MTFHYIPLHYITFHSITLHYITLHYIHYIQYIHRRIYIYIMYIVGIFPTYHLPFRNGASSRVPHHVRCKIREANWGLLSRNLGMNFPTMAVAVRDLSGCDP